MPVRVHCGYTGFVSISMFGVEIVAMIVNQR